MTGRDIVLITIKVLLMLVISGLFLAFFAQQLLHYSWTAPLANHHLGWWLIIVVLTGAAWDQVEKYLLRHDPPHDE